ncbi:hypothetical protein Tco_1189881 [Tanacetum coccineum]
MASIHGARGHGANDGSVRLSQPWAGGMAPPIPARSNLPFEHVKVVTSHLNSFQRAEDISPDRLLPDGIY